MTTTAKRTETYRIETSDRAVDPRSRVRHRDLTEREARAILLGHYRRTSHRSRVLMRVVRERDGKDVTYGIQCMTTEERKAEWSDYTEITHDADVGISLRNKDRPFDLVMVNGRTFRVSYRTAGQNFGTYAVVRAKGEVVHETEVVGLDSTGAALRKAVSWIVEHVGAKPDTETEGAR